MTRTTSETARRKLIPEMEGASARRYAKLRGTDTQLQAYRRQAAQIAETLIDGAAVLEVAPGPGYFAVELAKLGRYRITGLDVSATFVALAQQAAGRAGVAVDFLQGDVTAMPFDDDQFDLIICQAAFKNFSQPLTAINEMHRVLRPGGRAIIQDMSADADGPAIRAEVDSMKLGRLAALTTRLILTWLRRRAYSAAQFEQLAERSQFDAATVTIGGIGIEATLRKAQPSAGRCGPESCQVQERIAHDADATK
jgi:ubiquinone/menaquinone biosynthesis C-methylase UbiE